MYRVRSIRVTNHPLVIAALLCACSAISAARSFAEERQDKVVPLAKAHAHNDYLHARPLLDALDHGFTSVEADIYLVDGKLLVAHEPKELRAERTLAALYLDPLKERARRNKGWIFDSGRQFTLMIDIKTEAASTFAALHKELANYGDLLTTVRDGILQHKAVLVVISGNRAFEKIAAEKLRYAGIDGRLTDLESTEPAHLLPMISDNWTKHFRWNGEGSMPAEEREKLRRIATQTHVHGRRLRFWATPDKPAVWNELNAAGVDLINTDDLDGLRDFLQTAK